jgi:hypothetical protein
LSEHFAIESLQQHIIGQFVGVLVHKAVERGADYAVRVLPEFWSYKEPAWRGLKAAAKSEALSARTTADKNPKSETNPNHRNSKFKTNPNVLFRRWLWQPDSNIKQKIQEVEGL